MKLKSRNTPYTAEELIWTYGLILFFLGVILAIINPTYFDHTYTLEDGLLEGLSVLALGTISVVTFKRLLHFRTRYALLHRTVITLTALLFLFGTGEEISWGQRLIGIESPDFFRANNAQGETNLHNLIVGDTKINKLIFGKMVALFFLIYLAVLTPLHRKGGKIAQWIDALAIPIPTRQQWWGYIGVIVMVEGIVQLFSDTPKRGELTEFGVSVLVMLTVLYPSNLAIFVPRKQH